MGELFLPGAVMALIGGVGLRVTSSLFRTPRYVSNRDVYLSVTLAWVVAALLGGVPFLIEGTFDSLLDSTFEAMSGFTTTGSTLLGHRGPDASILFWRSMTQWLGGIGSGALRRHCAVIGAGAARLLGAEVSGLTQTRLTPRIADTAKALRHLPGHLSCGDHSAPSGACRSTTPSHLHDCCYGGFSPKTASIGFYDSRSP